MIIDFCYNPYYNYPNSLDGESLYYDGESNYQYFKIIML